MLDFLHTKKNRYGIKAILKWLWITSYGNRKQAIFNIILGIISVLLGFAFIWATKLTVDVASGQTSESSQRAFIDLGGSRLYELMYEHTTLRMAGFLLISLLLIQLLLNIANRWIKALLGVKAQNRMQQKIFRRLLNNEWSGLEKHHSGDILNRLERDVRDVVNLLTETLPNFITVCFQLVGAFIFL